MSKIRINDLARELEVKSKEILDALTSVGVTEKKTHSSSLEDHEADLVRKHLRGRSDAAPSGAKSSSRAAHGEEEIKTKIDLSHISRPGDVLRAITQQKGTPEPPASRPAAKPPATAPAAEAKADGKTEPRSAAAPPKAIPPKSASDVSAPPAPRMVTPASVAATYRPPSVVVIPPKVPVTPPAATTPAAGSSASSGAPSITAPRLSSFSGHRNASSTRALSSSECDADASCVAGNALGVGCAAAANDHAADRPAARLQSAFTSARIVRRQCSSQAGAGTTRARPANFPAHIASIGARRKRAPSSAASRRAASHASHPHRARRSSSARRWSRSGNRAARAVASRSPPRRAIEAARTTIRAARCEGRPDEGLHSSAAHDHQQ
jgi:hypothetical protein